MKYQTGRRFLLYPLLFVGLVLIAISCQSSEEFPQEVESLSPAGTAAPAEVAEADPQEETVTAADPTSTLEKPTPTNTPEALAEMAAEPAITETPPQQILPLEIIKQGFGREEGELGYGFLVKNPNPSVAVADTEFQVTAYDEDGLVLSKDSEYLTLILPDETLGIAGFLFLEDERPVANVIIQTNPGQPYFADISPALEVRSITYRPGLFFDRVTALIRNDSPTNLEDLRVSAIAYNRADEIVGAGYTFLSFLSSDTSMGVDITLDVDGIVDRVELYPRLSFFALFDVEEESFTRPVELSLLSSGFAQHDIEIGYGFIVENPAQVYSVADSEYQVTAFDARDSVLAVDEGYFELFLPGQTLGIGSTFFVEDGEMVDHITIQLKSGDYSLLEPRPELKVDNISLVNDGVTTLITGDIVNPYDRALENIRVSAVVFDDVERIVGGGIVWLVLLPADDKAAVEIQVSSAGNPISADLFAVVNEPMELE